MRVDNRSDICAADPVSRPQSIRSSYILLQLLQCRSSILLSIVLALLLVVQWPAECRAAEADEALPVAEAETTEAAVGDDEASETDEGLLVEELEQELDEELEAEEAEELVEEELGEGEADYSDIEEIRIEGRAGPLIETDSAQSALQFDASEIQALGVSDVSDIAKVTPNLEIRVSGATTANFFIRGVGLADFSANSASAVAIYQDGVPLNATAMQLVGLFDASSIEVLRGPQGSGSGRNASAGAIKIESRKPTGDYQAQLTTTLGAYASDDARKALIQTYEGALELPIVEDLLSTRLSFRVQSADPYMTNSCGDAPPMAMRIPRDNSVTGNRNQASICGEWDSRTFPDLSVSPIAEGLPSAVGDKGNWSARGLFRLQPSALDMDWSLNVHGSRLDQQSTLGQAMGTLQTLGRQTVAGYVEPDQLEEFKWTRGLGLSADERNEILEQSLTRRPLDIRPFRGDYNRVGQTTRDTWGTSVTGNFLFDDVGFLGPVELLSISAYDGYQRVRDTDQDFTPVVLFERQQDDQAWQLFQELKATGERNDGLLRWELGGYYLMENLQSEIDQQVNNPQFNFHRTFEQDLWSFAFYGGFGWDFLDDFTLDTGVRYNWERKRFDFLDRPVTGLPEAAKQSSTWTAPTALISLKYRFNDDVTAYWKYSRGWKGGHFNANDADVPPAKPETLDSVEAGLRGSWLDARLNLSGSVFYYKYRNYQVFLFENSDTRPPILEIINANDAEQYGIELDLELRPLQDWEWTPELLGDLKLTLRFGWLQSQFMDFVNLIERADASSGFIPFQEEINYTGNRLPNSPEYKVSATVEWPLDFGRYGIVTPRYDLTWTDDIFFDPNEGRGTVNRPGELRPDFTTGQRAYALHNLRLAYSSADGVFEIAGWVRNLTDERYKTFAFDASIFAEVVLNFVGEPRTAGVDVTLSF